MLKLVSIFFFLLFSFKSSSLNIEVSSFSFYGANPYTELYFRVAGNSVNWVKDKDTKSSSVEVLFFVKHADGSIAAYDKFELKSEIKDSIIDFIAVKRFRLKQGEYVIKIEANETLVPSNKVEMEQRLLVDSPESEFLLSDIMLLGIARKDSSYNALVKNDIYMEPLAYNLSPGDKHKLDFYIESYIKDTSAFNEYFLQYHIMEGFISNINTKPLFSKYKKIRR